MKSSPAPYSLELSSTFEDITNLAGSVWTWWLICSSGYRQLSCWLHLTNISPDVSFHLPAVFVLIVHTVTPFNDMGSEASSGLAVLMAQGSCRPEHSADLFFFLPPTGRQKAQGMRKRKRGADTEESDKGHAGLAQGSSRYCLFLTEALMRHGQSLVAICPFQACVMQA